MRSTLPQVLAVNVLRHVIDYQTFRMNFSTCQVPFDTQMQVSCADGSVQQYELCSVVTFSPSRAIYQAIVRSEHSWAWFDCKGGDMGVDVVSGDSEQTRALWERAFTTAVLLLYQQRGS